MPDFSITRCIRDFRNTGFDDESIKVATEDLNAGIDPEIVNCYMNMMIEKPNRMRLAKALHEGMPLELGQKIGKMSAYQAAEILTRVEERMPYDVIMKVIQNNPSAKHMEYAFEKIKQLMLGKAESVLDEADEALGKDEEPDTVKEEIKSDTTENETAVTEIQTPMSVNQTPATENRTDVFDDKTYVTKDESPVTEKPEPEVTVPETKPEPEQPVTPVPSPTLAPQAAPATYNTEMIEKFGNIFAKSITDIMTQNSIMMERVIAASEERTQKVLDKMLEKEPAVTAATVEAVKEPEEKSEPSILEETAAHSKPEEPEIKPAMHKEAEKEDAPFRHEEKATGEKKEGSIIDSLAKAYEEWHPEIQKAPSAETSSFDQASTAKRLEAYHEQTVSKMPSEVDGVMKMVRMPDGTVCPVFVEQTRADKPRGILGLCAKLFGKETKQHALLNMLIEGGLSPEQMEEIHRAIVLGFKDSDVRDLINSGLSAKEMNGIVSVIYADMHRGKK